MVEPRATRHLIEWETRHMSGGMARREVVIVRGEGAWLIDNDGRRILDLAVGNGWGCVGHSHPDVVAAIRKQAGRLTFYTESGFNDQRALWMKELGEVLADSLGTTERGALSIVHPCSSGTEAVEGAIKMARLFTGRPGIVATERGFHGRTLGALSATWKPHYRDPFAPLVPGFRHVEFNRVDALEAALTEDVAAFILEPVQGEGGIHPVEEQYVAVLQELCRIRGILLIADEVQTGIGRAGAWFASERLGLKPDICALGKALGGGVPMGAVVWREGLGRIETGRHASTFGGNPLACAASRAVLQVMRAERLPERSAELGQATLEKLRALNLPVIQAVRGLGLMIGIELNCEVQGFINRLMERGIWTLPAGPRVLRLLPPLVIREADLDQAISTIGEVLAE